MPGIFLPRLFDAAYNGCRRRSCVSDLSRFGTVLSTPHGDDSDPVCPVFVAPMVATPRLSSTWTFASYRAEAPAPRPHQVPARVVPARFYGSRGERHDLIPQEFGTG
jgi:hypothetical protein